MMNPQQIEQKVEDIQKQIQQFIYVQKWPFDFSSTSKEDGELVTTLDLFIDQVFTDSFIGKPIFSEESHKGFPFQGHGIILDPIDGTAQIKNKTFECAVSFSYIGNDFLYSWIWNPFSSFEVRHSSLKTQPLISSRISKKKLRGFVSREEFKFFASFTSSDIMIAPCGSIAFKLGLLSVGAIDFVVTKRPKNLWDIYAGTHLILLQGYSLFYKEEGEEFQEINSLIGLERLSALLTKNLYHSITGYVWCRVLDFIRIRDCCFRIESVDTDYGQS